MEFILIGGMWIICGFISWCLTLADFYDLGFKYPTLGTPDEQWENGGRSGVLPLAVCLAVLGPLGIVSPTFGMFFGRYWKRHTYWRVW